MAGVGWVCGGGELGGGGGDGGLLTWRAGQQKQGLEIRQGWGWKTGLGLYRSMCEIPQGVLRWAEALGVGRWALRSLVI